MRIFPLFRMNLATGFVLFSIKILSSRIKSNRCLFDFLESFD